MADTDEESSPNHTTDHDEIPKEDILNVVEKYLKTSNLHITHYCLEPTSQRIGLLGDHSFLKVKVQEPESKIEKELKFFVKFFPKYERVAAFAEGLGAFKKEQFVYELLEEFKKSYSIHNLVSNTTPKCFLAKENKYLILDDLTSHGFEELDKKEYLEYNTVLTVLQSLAQLHASSIIFEEKRSDELEQEYTLINEYSENFEESFFNDKEGFINLVGVEASIKGVISEIDIFEFPEKLPSGKSFKEVARSICNKIYDLVRPSKKYRNVLCHGDLWATNFLIKYDTRDGKKSPMACKFVDYQCGRYAPPSHDVLTLLHLTTSKEFRKKHMYEMIGMYYTYLEKHLKIHGVNLNKVIPFVDFMNSCEEQKLFAIIETAIYFQLILIDNDEIEQYFEDSELNRKALFEDRSRLVLAHMEKDEVYARRLKESIEDLKEFCNYI